MNKLEWELLIEVQGRLEAELIQSYLQAHGISVELFQEAVGHHVYPVMVNGLGRVEIFASNHQIGEARKLLEEFHHKP